MGFYLPATERDNNLYGTLYLIINGGAKFINFNISPLKILRLLLTLIKILISVLSEVFILVFSLPATLLC